MDANLEPLGLLVNEIGSYQGTVLLADATVNLEITASGGWTVTVLPLESARSWIEGGITGQGDDVVFYIGSTTAAAITHDGESNFAVIAHGASDRDLLVNEIGPYNGTVRLPGPSFVEITADGAWSITAT